MREQIKGLENHSGAKPQLTLLFSGLAAASGDAGLNRQAIDRNSSGIGRFKLIQAPQERALATAAWTDEHHCFTGPLSMINSEEDAGGVKGFNQVLNDDHSSFFFRADWRKQKPDSSKRN